jgi:hypothetical protein
VHIENREKGKVPKVKPEYAAFTIMDLIKAFFWMDVEGDAKHKPFYWTTLQYYRVSLLEPLARRLILL